MLVSEMGCIFGGVTGNADISPEAGSRGLVRQAGGGGSCRGRRWFGEAEPEAQSEGAESFDKCCAQHVITAPAQDSFFSFFCFFLDTT
jgi:hypothetical protein